jgi:GNAT superfamily N-acetyltransferase
MEPVTLSDTWRDRAVLERQWLDDELGSFVLGAELSGRPVRYAFLRTVAEKLAVSWTTSNPYADLAVLSVLPEVRGRGVGTMLMDATSAELRRQGVHDLAITVITTNSDAERRYKRRGATTYTTVSLRQVPAGAGSTTPAEPPG